MGNKNESRKSNIPLKDANKSKDVNLVNGSQIKGKVKFRIPLIAYPTIFFNDLRVIGYFSAASAKRFSK